jgi:hypothetical protein
MRSRAEHGVFYAVVCACILGWATALQGAPIDFRSDSGLITLKVTDVPRGDVISQLVGETPVEWRDASLREQSISGVYRGTLVQVLNEVLDGTDFIASYGDDQRIARVLVIGPAHPGSTGVIQPAADPNPTTADRLREKRLRQMKANRPIRRGKALGPATPQTHEDANP